jgi:hypothetical protein
VPARDDLRPLYITGHGLSVGKSNDVLKIRDREGVVQEARLHDISQVNVFGNVSVTSGALLVGEGVYAFPRQRRRGSIEAPA